MLSLLQALDFFQTEDSEYIKMCVYIIAISRRPAVSCAL